MKLNEKITINLPADWLGWHPIKSPSVKDYKDVDSLRIALNEFDEARKDWDENNTFIKSKYNRPGVLIEIQTEDGEVETLLIGDVNCYGGCSDEFTAFTSKSIVLTATLVYDKDQNQSIF